MAISRVEIKDFLVFKGEFKADFCPGVNVLIGGNGSGKTTLLKCLYELKRHYTALISSDGYKLFDKDGNALFAETKIEVESGNHKRDWGSAFIDNKPKNFIYIPEKDILEHARGLLTFIEQKQSGFEQIYRDVLIAAQDVPTKIQSEMQKSVGQKIAAAIGGDVHWDKGDGSFYTLKADGSRIPFTNEASGYKKLGYLGLLVSSGQLAPGSVLFWDEPENSINPNLISMLVDILLELSRNGVQIFIATHSEIFASYCAVNRQNGDSVMFYSLFKVGEQIKANSSDRFDLLEPNNLTAEPVKLYEKEIVKGLGSNV